jgi:hypothetical protein
MLVVVSSGGAFLERWPSGSMVLRAPLLHGDMLEFGRATTLDLKGVTGLFRISGLFSRFDSAAFIPWREVRYFEVDDEPGRYRVVVVLKDWTRRKTAARGGHGYAERCCDEAQAFRRALNDNT